jgi:hypothetical protein
LTKFISLFALLVLCFDIACAQVAFDPQAIGVGARALGMGRATAAVPDASESFFTNPAGLGEIDSFSITSMSGKVLDEANYIMLGGNYPLGHRSAIGLGYIGAYVAGIELRDLNKTYLGSADYGSNLLIASYGQKIGERTSIGVNLKYYSTIAMQNTSANGGAWNLDLGLLQSGLGCFSLGVVGQNLLGGNKMYYQNGTNEILPSTLKLGAALYLLGNGFRAALSAPVEISLTADTDFDLSTSHSTFNHFGLEFSPHPALSLRAGIDRDSLTFGSGINIYGISFQYAINNSDNYTNHFFSLSFNERGWPPEEPENLLLGKN